MYVVHLLSDNNQRIWFHEDHSWLFHYLAGYSYISPKVFHMRGIRHSKWVKKYPFTRGTTSWAAHMQPYVIHTGAAPTLSLPHFYTRYHRALWPPGPSQLAFRAASSNYNDHVNEARSWIDRVSLPGKYTHPQEVSPSVWRGGGRWFNLSGLSEPAALLRPRQERCFQSEKLTHTWLLQDPGAGQLPAEARARVTFQLTSRVPFIEWYPVMKKQFVWVYEWSVNVNNQSRDPTVNHRVSAVSKGITSFSERSNT